MTETRTTSSTGGQKGVKAERYDLLPFDALDEVARLYAYGALKYDDHNWRRGYEWSKSFASMMRHARAFWMGETYDVCPGGAESGECPYEQMFDENGVWTHCSFHSQCHHLACVEFHANALIVFTDAFPEFDDRPSTVISRREIQESINRSFAKLEGRLLPGSNVLEPDEIDQETRATMLAAGLLQDGYVSEDVDDGCCGGVCAADPQESPRVWPYPDPVLDPNAWAFRHSGIAGDFTPYVEGPHHSAAREQTDDERRAIQESIDRD